MDTHLLSLFVKMFFLSTGLVGIFMLTIWIKQLYDKNAEFTVHSCKTDNISSESTACAACGITNLVSCPEKS
ncbi:MAG: hypothetical protein GXO79_15210 [Chlorobi bacterium]|nr:hypothetical protein [Chlorobiota bacterium]